MNYHEGSVSTESEDIDESQDESTSEQSDNTETEGQTSETGDTSQDESTQSTLPNQEQQKPELTDKGTKLDPDPLSRANQELANERKKIKDYEEVLTNPILLKGYLAQFGTQEAQQPEKQ